MKDRFLLTEESTKSSALKKHIIQYIILSGESSIADLGKETGLSIPTVTKLISELLDEGYLLDLGKQNTSGGRRPSIYGINPQAGYFVGIDVQRKSVLMATINFDGKLIDEEDNIPYEQDNTQKSLDELCGIVKEHINNLSIDKSKIQQIGINLSGRVNTLAGYSYSFFGFSETPLSQILEEKLGYPVTLENDSRAMTYGEYMVGVGKGSKNMLFINPNWGLGAGYVLDGKLYYGKSGFSGEIGHVPAFDNEILCRCGKKGCLETETSGFAIQRMIIERYKQGHSTILGSIIDKKGEVTLPEFVDAVLKEDVLAIEIVEYIGVRLGRWIAALINIFNPELVVVGGPLAITQDYLRLPINSAMKKYSLNLVSRDTELVMSKLGLRAGVIGACLLTRSKMFGLI